MPCRCGFCGEKNIVYSVKVHVNWRARKLYSYKRKHKLKRKPYIFKGICSDCLVDFSSLKDV